MKYYISYTTNKGIAMNSHAIVVPKAVYDAVSVALDNYTTDVWINHKKFIVRITKDLVIGTSDNSFFTYSTVSSPKWFTFFSKFLSGKVSSTVYQPKFEEDFGSAFIYMKDGRIYGMNWSEMEASPNILHNKNLKFKLNGVKYETNDILCSIPGHESFLLRYKTLDNTILTTWDNTLIKTS